MTWDNKHRHWKLRKNRPVKMIGRMYFAGPSSGERFYLRMLLTIVKGSVSFEDLRTWNDVVHPTFKSACIARGLLDSDEQWDRSLAEAGLWQGGCRVGNRPSVTRQTAEQTAEIFDLVSSRLIISGTKDISSVCSAVFKSSSSTIDVYSE